MASKVNPVGFQTETLPNDMPIVYGEPHKTLFQRLDISR